MTLKMELSFKLTPWDLERRKLNHVAASFCNFSLHYLHSMLGSVPGNALGRCLWYQQGFAVAALMPLEDTIKTPLMWNSSGVNTGRTECFLALFRPGRSKSSPGCYLLLCLSALSSFKGRLFSADTLSRWRGTKRMMPHLAVAVLYT